MAIYYEDAGLRLWHGSNKDILPTFADESFDSIVTDPPYELGFMGKGWDSSGIAYDVDVWRECYRVLKPGGYLLAFGGTRTWHRVAVAIEDAGFEIRDSIAWLQGAGFPKSHNVSRALDGSRCGCPVQYNHASDVRGVRVDVQSHAEPSSQGRESDVLASVQWKGEGSRTNEARTQGARSLDSDERSVVSREDDGRPQPGMEGWRDVQEAEGELRRPEVRTVPRGPARNVEGGRVHHGAPPRDGKARATAVDADGVRESHRPQSAEQRSGEPRTLADQRGPQAGGSWPICERCGKPMVPDGLGTALKPAFEPVIVARKPLRGTVAANVLAYGTGALNIDACRVGYQSEADYQKNAAFDRARSTGAAAMASPNGPSRAGDRAGRFPANVVLDDTQAAELDRQSGTQRDGVAVNRNRTDDGSNYNASSYRITKTTREDQGYGGGGGASRFFPTFRYEAKAPTSERPNVDGTMHATVKPLDLMRWLVRLVTRPGGRVLDPFAGSGTTGEAALLEGMQCDLIELETDHLPLILARVRKPLQPAMFGDWEGGDVA